MSVLVGTPRVGANALVGEGRIAVGQTLTTDAGSRASDGGQRHRPGDGRRSARACAWSRSRDGHHRLALDRGTLHASIAAPPGQFVVNTPSATATDLGCIYSLHVDEDGSGLLTVEAGWVAFEERGRESFVPAGASSRTDRVSGPGTPRYDDAEPAFRDALDEVDNGRDAGRKAASLRYVLEHARGRDAMTLWHLISARRPPPIAPPWSTRSTARVPMPADGLARRGPAPRSRGARSVVGHARPRRGELVAKVERRVSSGRRLRRSPRRLRAARRRRRFAPRRRPRTTQARSARVRGGSTRIEPSWMQSATGPWHAGYNQKNMMVKPHRRDAGHLGHAASTRQRRRWRCDGCRSCTSNSRRWGSRSRRKAAGR